MERSKVQVTQHTNHLPAVAVAEEEKSLGLVVEEAEKEKEKKLIDMFAIIETRKGLNQNTHWRGRHKRHWRWR